MDSSEWVRYIGQVNRAIATSFKDGWRNIDAIKELDAHLAEKVNEMGSSENHLISMISEFSAVWTGRFNLQGR